MADKNDVTLKCDTASYITNVQFHKTFLCTKIS